MRIRSALTALLLIAGSGAPARAADPVGTDVNSLGLTAQYEVDATFGWDDRRAEVSTTAAVSNATRWAVSTIAFNLATLRTGRAEVTSVTVDGTAVDSTIDDQTILVPPIRRGWSPCPSVPSCAETEPMGQAGEPAATRRRTAGRIPP
jgi:hypothetical protein